MIKIGDLTEDSFAVWLNHSDKTNWMNALNGGSTRTEVRNGFAYSLEFQGNLMHLCPTTSNGASTSANLKYVLNDAQGSTRAVMNNSGSGTSTIISRHDYLYHLARRSGPA